MINSNNVFEQNYRFFNHDEFKNDLKDIPWDNILSSDDISASLAFHYFFVRVNTLLDEHAPNHKLSIKEISLKAKPWINKNIQAVMRERDRLFKRCYNENNSTPNSLMVNGNVFITKNCIADIFNDFLLMLVQILRLKYRKEKDLSKHI